MARGAEAKARRKEQRKKAKDEASSMLDGNTNEFGPADDDDDASAGNEEPQEMFPSATGASGTEEGSDGVDLPPPKKKSSKKRGGGAGGDGAARQGTSDGVLPPKRSGGGIKTMPLILLVLMTGTTLLPALIFASDYLGTFLQKNHVFGTIGYKLGVGTTPKKRVLSFYEKHDPSKINDVPKILSKYYGDYPKLIKSLERKYQDYGYFIDWERDEAPMTLAFEQLEETRTYMVGEFNRHSPQFLKTAVRNIQYNVGGLVKKGKKVWKKTVWPIIEPVFGVPKGGAAQKRKDAQKARSNKAGPSGGRRRRNKDYRDDIEDEH